MPAQASMSPGLQPRTFSSALFSFLLTQLVAGGSVVMGRKTEKQNCCSGRNTIMETISQAEAAGAFSPHRILVLGKVCDSSRAFGCASFTKPGYPGQSPRRQKESGISPTPETEKMAIYQELLTGPSAFLWEAWTWISWHFISSHFNHEKIIALEMECLKLQGKSEFLSWTNLHSNPISISYKRNE